MNFMPKRYWNQLPEMMRAILPMPCAESKESEHKKQEPWDSCF